MRGPFETAASGDDPTLADFAGRFRNMAADGRFVGTPGDVADELEALMEVTDADGFQFSPVYYAPDYFGSIVEHLVPELQKRGRVRTGYAGSTLRSNLLS